jgi:[ribosomal protein S18]-alanine N-acetyltransferase
MVEWGAERARVGRWRGDSRTAYLSPVPEGPPPSADFLRRCADTLTVRGFERVVTPALSPAEQRPFLQAGFEQQEKLHVLAHDLLDLPPRQRRATRRGRIRHGADVLAVDQAAFGPFWRFDEPGLREALTAVPVTRFRVVHVGRALVAYAVSGRAAGQGYLQRLAVHPSHQRAGHGATLTADALHWMRRRGAVRAVVNTQLGNEPALALYLGLGFRLQPGGLAVLGRELT